MVMIEFDALAQARRDANPEINRYHTIVGKPGEIDPAAAQDAATYLADRSTEPVEQADHYTDTLADTGLESRSISELAHKLGDAERADDTTMADDVADVLLAKVDDLAKSVKTTRNPDGLPTEARSSLFDRVLRIVDIDGGEEAPETPAPFDWAKEDESSKTAPVIEAKKAADLIELPVVIPADEEEAPSRLAPLEQSEVLKPLGVEVESLEVPLKGEDTILKYDLRQVYGVFDGVGGGRNADGASQAASHATQESYIMWAYEQPRTVTEAVQRMQSAFAKARMAVDELGRGVGTTAVAVNITTVAEDSKTYAVWGNAGDSRLFLRKADGQIVEVSTEQCHEVRRNEIYNMFGSGYPGTDDEFGAFEVQPGDRLMLCSDGITGDWDEQKIEPAIFSRAFNQPTAAASAADFMTASKKSDDKSVIVIDVK